VLKSTICNALSRRTLGAAAVAATEIGCGV
jgi:hypothetical protein